MTEEEKLIARLNELDVQLGQEVDTSGIIQELSMRTAELEEELNEGTDTDSVENGGVSGDSASAGTVDSVPPVDTVLNDRTDDALTAVETLVTLHIEALHATRDGRVSIVEAGTVIRVTEADVDSLVAFRLIHER